MSPSKKTRSVNKRFASEITSSKKLTTAPPLKSKPRKRKLAELLGPKWRKKEIERFYDAYRKHGKDWDKVAAVVRRPVEMVEAIYTMNRAYLSLPKGYASAAGLIAMMEDHYTNLDASDSDHDIHEVADAPQKPKKRARASKREDGPSLVPLRSQSAASDDGFLSLLKKKRSESSKPWAVGKRTPRVHISHSGDRDNKEKNASLAQEGVKAKFDARDDDDVEHEIALALAGAAQTGHLSQVSQRPKRTTKSLFSGNREKTNSLTPHQKGDKKKDESRITNSKHRGCKKDGRGSEMSVECTETDAGDDKGSISLSRRKRYNRRQGGVNESKDYLLGDVKEAFSGTDEGKRRVASRGGYELEDVSYKCMNSVNSEKTSKKEQFGEDEDAALDALQTLANLSARLPDMLLDTESSTPIEEEKAETVSKSKSRAKPSAKGVRTTSLKTTKQRKGLSHDVSAFPKSKKESTSNSEMKSTQISLPPKERISLENVKDKEHTDSHHGESEELEATDDSNNFDGKGRLQHDVKLLKQGKSMEPLEPVASNSGHGRKSNDSVPSTAMGLSTKQFTLPTKVRSKRKINKPKPFIEKDRISSQNVSSVLSSSYSPSFQEKTLDLKDKLSNCLSWHQVQKWVVYEWFYSAIDYPWFAKKEFDEYLDHVGLVPIPRLTRVEWGVIRSSLGKPRRFSEKFLQEEREKLNLYRESVRKHYSELRAGKRAGLPTDLARPLSAGQRVIALHPRTQEIHDGSVLTIDHSRCRVQFDQPELGVEFVMDVDCMPLNPVENMPISLVKHNVITNKFIENINKNKVDEKTTDNRIKESIGFLLVQNMEISDSLPDASGLTNHISNSPTHSKVGSASLGMELNLGWPEIINTKQAAEEQPCMDESSQSKEADIRALCELTRALDKKGKVLSVLKEMNDEVVENEKDGKNSLKDSQYFQKHYAAVLLQLKEVNEQVSSALHCLRQRNTYKNNIESTLLITDKVDETVPQCSKFDPCSNETTESRSLATSIVEISRAKAQKMVNLALQALSSLSRDGRNTADIEVAIDFVNDRLSDVDSIAPTMNSFTTASTVDGNLASQIQSSSHAETAVHAPDPCLPDQNDLGIPSDLIAQCVATFLMIQKCTERQFPPSDVAQVIESAVTNLKPKCPENVPIYAELQKCMGIIKNQILALIPA